MYSQETINLSKYRLEKAASDLSAAKKTLELEMYDTAANRSYYAIFHAARAVLALDGKDYKKHSGVISTFRKDYIKTSVFDKRMSDIIKNAFDLRTETDYDDFYVVSKEEVREQVEDAIYFVGKVRDYLKVVFKQFTNLQ